MRELMIDYLDDKLSGELKIFIKAHIEKNPAAANELDELRKVLSLVNENTELETPDYVKIRFLKALEEEKLGQNSRNSIQRWLHTTPAWVKNAAMISIVLVSGILLGRIGLLNSNSDEIARLSNELEATKELVVESLNNQHSASTRLKGVNASYQLATMDSDLVTVLVNTMNSDPNANVRLAAVQALSRFSEQPEVANELINSLKSQTNPVVQIALINELASLEDERAVGQMQELLNDNETIESVQDELKLGMYKISTATNTVSL